MSFNETNQYEANPNNASLSLSSYDNATKTTYPSSLIPNEPITTLISNETITGKIMTEPIPSVTTTSEIPTETTTIETIVNSTLNIIPEESNAIQSFLLSLFVVIIVFLVYYWTFLLV